MESSNEDNRERGYLLPPGCKDLFDVIKLPKAPEPVAAPYPPITRKITLPNVVAVRFLIETSGQDFDTIVALMHKLRIFVPHSLRFAQWPGLLRGLSISGCFLFGIADTLFTLWYFLALVVDAYGHKSDSSV